MHTSVENERQAREEQVAINAIMKAHQFLLDIHMPEKAAIWLEENLEPVAANNATPARETE